MEIKKENFKRISENRVNKIITTIRQLQNLTNTSFYEYENEDIEKLFNDIEKEIEITKEKLLNNKNGKEFEL